jgi:hypothetical protein
MLSAIGFSIKHVEADALVRPAMRHRSFATISAASFARPHGGVRAYAILAAVYQPTFCPLFCSSSHFCNGAK